MTAIKKGNLKKGFQPPFYPLKKVRELVDKNQVWINQNARDTAYSDFGWDANDILAAIKKLQPKDYQKKEPSRYKSGTSIDY